MGYYLRKWDRYGEPKYLCLNFYSHFHLTFRVLMLELRLYCLMNKIDKLYWVLLSFFEVSVYRCLFHYLNASIGTEETEYTACFLPTSMQNVTVHAKMSVHHELLRTGQD